MHIAGQVLRISARAIDWWLFFINGVFLPCGRNAPTVVLDTTFFLMYRPFDINVMLDEALYRCKAHYTQR